MADDLSILNSDQRKRERACCSQRIHNHRLRVRAARSSSKGRGRYRANCADIFRFFVSYRHHAPTSNVTPCASGSDEP